ncbi:MAG: hypothetical protein H0W76_00225 [Pyrinomonadaceae bacterium]|nr:hypothetical protein [Pyrinomonadaceae bacterium]
MRYEKFARSMMLGCVALCAVGFGGAGTAARAQEASTSYQGTQRDPFMKYRPPVKRKAVKKSLVPVQLPAPSIQERIAQFKAQKAAAMSAQRVAPKPTTALLLEELQVIGIFRTPRGPAAMVEATPIKLSYVVYPGESFFNGLLVAIEENRLVFRRETKWSNGRLEISVENKPLRLPGAVENSLTSNNSAAAKAASSQTIKGREDTVPVTDKQ